MNATIKTAKTTAALKQIEILQAEKVRIQDSWLARGIEKTTEMVNAISDQIIALYEEIDALEAGETSQAGRSENQVGKTDEIAISPLELASMKDLGWTIEDLIREKAKKARRMARR